MKPSKSLKITNSSSLALEKNFSDAALPEFSAQQLEQRDKALKDALGIFKGSDVFPEDGLAYQLEIPAEWRQPDFPWRIQRHHLVTTRIA